jgi:hypothetical protein
MHNTNGFLSVRDLQRAGARDNRLVFKLLSRLNSGSMLLADRGYDANWLRAFAAKKGPTFRQDAIATSPSASTRTESLFGYYQCLFVQ